MSITIEQFKQSGKFVVFVFNMRKSARCISYPLLIAKWIFSFDKIENQLYILLNSKKIKVINQEEVLTKLSNNSFKLKHLDIKCENSFDFTLAGDYKQIELIE